MNSFFKRNFEPKYKIKVRTAWVNDNAFYVLVHKYEIKKRMFRKDVLVLVEIKNHDSWESLMRHFWEENLLPSGQYIIEVDSKI